RDVRQRIADRRDVPLLVVCVARGLARRADLPGEAVQRVEYARPDLREISGRIEHLLLRAVAHRVERVRDAGALDVGDPGPPVRRFVRVWRERAVRRRHLRELAGGVVVVARRLAAYAAGDEPLARVVAELGDHLGRVDYGGRLPMR